jgi:Putative auto-transporter adhesin, head GIN domain
MKNKLLLTVLAAPILFSACNMGIGSNVKYTTLPAEGRNMPVQSFSAIKANGVFNIILQQGTTESVVVKGEYPSDLKITNDGNTLVIIDTLSNHSNIGTRKTDIYVTFIHLDAMETESVGQTKALDTIKSARFSYESDGVGESILLLNADSVTASENGVGSLNIAGKAHYATIEDNGVGALKARDFKVGILHATVSGVGAAKVYADSEIYLDVNGVGGLTYFGPAKVMEKSSSGVGKVEHGD